MTSRNATPSTLLAENTEGYKEKTKTLTRAQVKVIVKFLDPPI